MKKLHLLLFLTLAVLSASAQKVYFVYIQTEVEQPFFVKINQRTQWSSPAGYIILSKLHDSSYNFSVGFPQNKWPEQKFTVAVNKKDHGYLLKNLQEKGWGLYDLQTMEMQMASNTIINNDNANTGSVTPFTEILAKAADDPSLKEKTVHPVKETKTEPLNEPVKETISPVETAVNTTPVLTTPDPEQANSKKSKRKKQKEAETVTTDKTLEQPVSENKEVTKTEVKPEIKTESKPEVKENEVPSEIKKDTVVTKPEVKQAETLPLVKVPVVIPEDKKEEKTDTEIKEAVVQAEEKKDQDHKKYKATKIKKYSESSTTEGFGLVYIDNYENGVKDTIRLVIPNPKPVVEQVKEEPKEEKKFLDINTQAPNNSTVPATIKEPETNTEPVTNTEPSKNTEPVTRPSAKKTNCSDLASEDEFVKLRKRMAGEKEDKMLGEAKKYFKARCFSTNQVQVLGRLFETDEARYNFFDAAYTHVYDPEVYSTLQSDFKDSYYSGRFKAMLRN